jgi:site-specific DNA-cytosine methylase
MKSKNGIVLFEKSQAVCMAFRNIGHNFYSCDLQDCDQNPQYHLKMDCYDALRIQKWDMIIMHPPCTALSVSGNAHYGTGKHKNSERLRAIFWTCKLWRDCTSDCDKVAMENPVGVLSSFPITSKPSIHSTVDVWTS